MSEFEKSFSELQADMIDVCMEYVEDRADKVYVYASCEGNIISSKFFYRINNQYLKCHKVNDALNSGDKQYDSSPDRMSMVLDILNEDTYKIQVLCEKYEKDMPTEMKLIYTVGNGHFKAEYHYDLVYTNDAVKTSKAVAEEWFEEVKINNL